MPDGWVGQRRKRAVRGVGSESVVSLRVIAGASPRPARVRRIALAYSGGLLATCLIAWLREHEPESEVLAVAVNVGQITDEATLVDRARASGAVDCVVVDARETFLREVALPTLRAGAIHERKYRLGIAMARPVIAAQQVAVAHREGCSALAHGVTSRSNDRVRFAAAYAALAPGLDVLTPRDRADWTVHSRDDALPYLAARGIELAPARTHGGNLWQCAAPDPDDVIPFAEPERVSISFEQGWPVALDGVRLAPVDLLESLNARGLRHRIGLETGHGLRLVGRGRPRPAAPGGAILTVAHRALEEATVDPATLRLKDLLAELYADVVYSGQWFTPLRTALDAFVAKTQAVTTGEIHLNLYNGTAAVAGQATELGDAAGRTRRAGGHRGNTLATIPRLSELEQILAGPEPGRLVEMVK